jgi:hypothetical protein
VSLGVKACLARFSPQSYLTSGLGLVHVDQEDDGLLEQTEAQATKRLSGQASVDSNDDTLSTDPFGRPRPWTAEELALGPFVVLSTIKTCQQLLSPISRCALV